MKCPHCGADFPRHLRYVEPMLRLRKWLSGLDNDPVIELSPVEASNGSGEFRCNECFRSVTEYQSGAWDLSILLNGGPHDETDEVDE